MSGNCCSPEFPGHALQLPGEEEGSGWQPQRTYSDPDATEGF